MIKVFYDGKCGLCSREINHYKSIAPDETFDWQDIVKDPEQLNALGVSLADGLRRLHVSDNEGNLHVGVDAFIVIWRQLPRWQFLAPVIAIPGVRHITSILYAWFADWKFKRSAHCQLAEHANH